MEEETEIIPVSVEEGEMRRRLKEERGEKWEAFGMGEIGKAFTCTFCFANHSEPKASHNSLPLPYLHFQTSLALNPTSQVTNLYTALSNPKRQNFQLYTALLAHAFKTWPPYFYSDLREIDGFPSPFFSL